MPSPHDAGAPDPGAPRSRRGNGLPAADWGALVDLDPRLSEALLTRLARDGVAAYVEPAGGAPDAFSRAVTLPDRPLHRLWVDVSRADDARAVVSAEVADLTSLLAESDPGATAHGLVQPVPRSAGGRVLPPPALPGPQGAGPAAVPPAPAVPPSPAVPPTGAEAAAAPAPADPPGADDTEAQWRQIVEGFGKDVDSPVPPWPVVEDVDGGSRRPAAPDTGEEPAPRRRRRTDRPAGGVDPQDALPGWLEPEALEDEGHYVPPPPPPAPRVRPRTLAAVGAVLLGVVLIFAPALLGLATGTDTALLGVLLTAGGAGALIWWVRDAPPHDSGPDDGAVV